MDSEETLHGLPHTTMVDEIASALTHGVGLLFSIAAMSVLVWEAWLHGGIWRIVSCAIFGATLVLVYLSSTLYHAVQNPTLKKYLRIFDHAAIYLLIAGTYTPFALVTLGEGWGWALFASAWGVGILGIFHKLRKRNRFGDASVVLYLVQGWMVVFVLQPLLDVLPTGGLVWLIAGGLTYTAGVLFYRMEGKRFAHAVWHLFVMGGSTCHVVAVLFYVIPPV